MTMKLHSESRMDAAAVGKLRVAMLVTRFPVLSETFVLEQVRGLTDRGHHVDVFAVDGVASGNQPDHRDYQGLLLKTRTFTSPPKPTSGRGRLLQVSSILGKQAIVHPVYLGKWVGGKFLRSRMSLRSFSACARLFETPYDILHCQFGTLGRHAVELADLGARFKRLVVSFRGADISSELRRRGQSFYLPIFSKADLLMPVSEAFAQRLIELGCPRVKVLVHRSGIDCRRFAFREPEPATTRAARLITVGRLTEKKGVGQVLEAVAGLIRQGKQVEYRMVGDGPLYHGLRRQAEQLGLGQIVSFLGALPQHEAIRQLENSDVFVSANKTAEDGDQEGIPNTIKEAMAVGLPVAATRHGGIPELIDNHVHGLLVAENDPHGLRDRLVWLIDHQEQWSRLASASRTRIERDYQLDDWNDLLVDRYRDLLDQDRETRFYPRSRNHFRAAA